MLKSTDIIYSDENYVIINKPAGLLVHPSYLDKHESQSAMKQTRDLLGKWVYPVHRLDRPTSGVLVFGLSSEAAAALVKEFTERKVKKQYVALVRGYTEDKGSINHPLKELWDKMTDRSSSRDKPAQEAVTDYITLERIELPFAVRPHPTSRYSLVSAAPQTGRQRQIRRHFKSIFHPIIGDAKHGDGHHNRMLQEKYGLNRLMLHSNRISFNDPFSNKLITAEASWPEDFSSLLARMGFAMQSKMLTEI